MTAFFVYFVIPKILPHPSFIEINFYDCLRASEKVASNLFSRLLQQLQRRGLLYQNAMHRIEIEAQQLLAKESACKGPTASGRERRA